MTSAMLRKVAGHALLGLASLGVAACGTNYKVFPAPILKDASNTTGLYFALPRTKVGIEFVAEETRVSYGDYYSGDDLMSAEPRDADFHRSFSAITDKLVQSCHEYDAAVAKGQSVPEPDHEYLPKEVLTPDPVFSISDYAMASRSVADGQQIYRLEIATETFASYKHTLEMADDGRLKAAATTVNDGFSPVALKLFGSLVDAGVASIGGGAKIKGSVTYCAGLRKYEPGYNKYKADLAKFNATREQLLADKKLAKTPEKYVAALEAVNTAIAKLKEDNAGVRSHFEKVEKKTSYVLLTEIDPVDFADAAYQPKWQAFKPTFALTAEQEKAKRLSLLQGQTVSTYPPATLPDELSKELAKLIVVFTRSPGADAAPLIAAVRADDRAAETAVLGRAGVGTSVEAQGYPYRFPVSVEVRIFRKQTSPAKLDKVAGATVAIAQFSPMLSLPMRFDGSEGSLDLTYNSSTGGLTKAVVGSKPQGETALSSYADGINKLVAADRKAGRADEDVAEAAAKAAANAEIDALKKERELLELRIKVRELRAEAGEE